MDNIATSVVNVPVVTLFRPVTVISSQSMDSVTSNIQVQGMSAIEKTLFEVNHHIYTDQYGNSVQIQAQVDQPSISTQINVVLVDKPLDQPSPLTLDSLCSNPFLHRLVSMSPTICVLMTP